MYSCITNIGKVRHEEIKRLNNIYTMNLELEIRSFKLPTSFLFVLIYTGVYMTL